jgi:hypothetical protein
MASERDKTVVSSAHTHFKYTEQVMPPKTLSFAFLGTLHLSPAISVLCLICSFTAGKHLQQPPRSGWPPMRSRAFKRISCVGISTITKSSTMKGSAKHAPQLICPIPAWSNLCGQTGPPISARNQICDFDDFRNHDNGAPVWLIR